MIALIFGAGPQGRVIQDILLSRGEYDSIEFIDDNKSLWGTRVNGTLVTGGFDSLVSRRAEDLRMIIALGKSPLRLAIGAKALQNGIQLLNAVHRSAVVMPSATLGSGVMVAACAVVNSNVQVGDHVIINSGAVTEHDSVIGNGVSISPGVQLGGRSWLGECAFLGTGAIVLPRTRIGAGAVVAAGALVTHDVPPNVLVRGIPARVVEETGDKFDWNRVL